MHRMGSKPLIGGAIKLVTTEANLMDKVSRDRARDDWFGLIQSFLEERMEDAPDETCRTMARDFWDQIATFTDDD